MRLRYYLARSVSILLVNFLLVPTVVSLLFSVIEWLAEYDYETRMARFGSWGRVRADYAYEWLIQGEMAIERWVQGTRQPKVEVMKG